MLPIARGCAYAESRGRIVNGSATRTSREKFRRTAPAGSRRCRCRPAGSSAMPAITRLPCQSAAPPAKLSLVMLADEPMSNMAKPWLPNDASSVFALARRSTPMSVPVTGLDELWVRAGTDDKARWSYGLTMLRCRRGSDRRSKATKRYRRSRTVPPCAGSIAVLRHARRGRGVVSNRAADSIGPIDRRSRTRRVSSLPQCERRTFVVIVAGVIVGEYRYRGAARLNVRVLRQRAIVEKSSARSAQLRSPLVDVTLPTM